MNQQSSPQDPLVLSYLSLRKAVGIIAFAMPFVLAIGKILLQGPGVQSSISAYYYTDMRDVFIGCFCAIAVFQLSTKGYGKKDQIIGILACIFTLGTAFIPVTPDTGATPHQETIGWIHYVFAGFLLFTLAYFSLVLFTKTDPDKRPTRRKLQRNTVYKVCGYTILASIFTIVVISLPMFKDKVARFQPQFWLESLAVVVFGVSWLTKGEAILKDEEDQASVSTNTQSAARR
jgi:protein-S-isoprenylcysteine O-methyltransferase Ste14